MKQYTDFNDLATKSVLGSERVKRQLQPIAEDLMGLRPAIARQKQQIEMRRVVRMFRRKMVSN